MILKVRSGGARPGAGRKPKDPALDARLTLSIEEEFLLRIDRARGPISRGEFLRRGLAALIHAMETDPETALVLPPTGERKAFPLEVPSPLVARAKALVAAGRAASVIDLVRGAGALMVEKME